MRKISMPREEVTSRWNRVSAPTQVLLTALFVLLILLSVLPLAFVTVVSLSSGDSIAARGYSFVPSEWSLEAYRYMFTRFSSVGHSVLVSVLVTAAGTVLSLILISTMAFTLSRQDFRLRACDTGFITRKFDFFGAMFPEA